jgi:hypothetical protein
VIVYKYIIFVLRPDEVSISSEDVAKLRIFMTKFDCNAWTTVHLPEQDVVNKYLELVGSGAGYSVILARAHTQRTANTMGDFMWSKTPARSSVYVYDDTLTNRFFAKGEVVDD